MTQKKAWLLLSVIYLAAIGLDWGGSASESSTVLYVLAGIIAFRLAWRQFAVTVLVLGISLLIPLVHSGDLPRQTLERTAGCVCLACLGFARRYQPDRPETGSATEVVPNPAEAETTFVDYNVESAEPDDFTFDPTEQSPVEPQPHHLTRVQETSHRHHREPGQFALDAEEPRDYIKPALERLHASGRFDDAQMNMIANEMRVLEERGLVADFVSCLPSGTRVGRFIIEESLGRGGEGNVYRGHDDSGQPGAIKILHNLRVSDRFRREMHLVRQLAHPNIVTAYEVGEFRALPFITMELLAGPDLYALVKRSGPVKWQLATQYILQATRALAHAHKRCLIHRDVKPGNMILDSAESIKLVDFGLAAMGPTTTLATDSVYRYETRDGNLAGTLPFMAPEQARSLANADVRSDVYGLGATWFYLLTGRERLKGHTFSQQFENLLVHRRFNALPDNCMPDPLIEIYRKMVCYEAKERYESCEAVGRDIEAALKESGKLVIPDRINVLVIEDSQTDMLFTIEMLRRSNSTLIIHQARSLSSGIEACRNLNVGLVLLDLTLPDSSGVNTVKQFLRSVSDVPLVVLTGMTEDNVGEDCLNAGADTFVSKHGLTAHRMERTIFVTLSRHGHARRKSTSNELAN